MVMNNDRETPPRVEILDLLDKIDTRRLSQVSISQVDADGDGHVELHELKKFLPNEPHDQVEEEFKKHDHNDDGRLSRPEFRNLVRGRAMRFARLVVLPKTARTGDVVDGIYSEEYTCCPPPIFMLSITITMLGIFAYHTAEIIEKSGWIGINGPAPLSSVLIYNPYKRYEAWRFLTYMFVHSGWMHITSNVIMQLFLGILLEMVHKWWRVLIVYFAGVIAGSLTTSLTDPRVYLAGASGGVYALITAHMATVIMNWNEMEMPWVRVISFTAFTIMDVGTALYYRYVAEQNQKVGYAAHFGGALAGLLVGIYTLRNLRRTKVEDRLWWAMLIFSLCLFAFCIGWNVIFTSHFPPSCMTDSVTSNRQMLC